MNSDTMSLALFFGAIFPLLYLTYFISKSYQVKRVIQMTKSFNIPAHIAIFLNCLLINLDFFISLLTKDPYDTSFAFFKNIINYSFYTPFFIGLVLIYCRKVRINAYLFNGMIGLPALFNLIYFISIVISKFNVFTFLVFAFLLIQFIIFYIKNIKEEFTIENTVYIEIFDYSHKFYRLLNNLDKLLTMVFDHIFGGLPVLPNREERPFHFLSLPLVIVFTLAIFKANIYVFLTMFILSFVFGNYIYKSSKNSKFPLLTQVYSFITSSVFIYDIIHLIKLISHIFFKNRSFVMKEMIGSFCNNIFVGVTSLGLLKNESFRMFLASISTSATLKFLGSIFLLSIKSYIFDRNMFEYVFNYTPLYFFALYHQFMYLLILFNYELNGYKLKRDLGIFLVVNCFIFSICVNNVIKNELNL